ncbi:MAG: enoyl-CoA hydratase/isomerase family protein [Deltaproteobacteria bacterium]|nr:MAG: enoyl-CoA hydratase/isomerase family protein [Deltaproteobacteria bacterium]
MSEVVRCERRGPVAVLTLDRPKAFNALSRAVLEALLAHAEAIAADGAVRAVVVTGAGRAFSAGADIDEMRPMNALAAEAFSRLGHRAFHALENLGVPTLAAVNGFALGGGCELACACDWIYASSAARFGQPEVNLGLIPGFGGTSRLLRRVGVAWAREIVLTGERLDAETALRIGLVNRVFEPDALLDAAIRVGETIATRGPLAVAAAKRVMQAGQDANVEVAHALEQSAFGAVFATADREEGIEAFLEKREPKFEGR